MRQTDLGVLRTEAFRVSKNIVKAELKAKGIRLSSFRLCDLNAMAKGYFVLHRAELIGDALGSLCWHRLCAELKTSAQKSEAQSMGLSAVQMSGSKVEADR
jgi:hypothetical protein